ncbi:MAG: hypothetical protein JWQ71_68 [Pedosphaera sp.]|nr:hypothetical protein [Pedosphaera sp.]
MGECAANERKSCWTNRTPLRQPPTTAYEAPNVSTHEPQVVHQLLGRYAFMKNPLIIILSGLLICGCSRSSSGPRTTPATEGIKGQLIGLAQLVDAGNTTPEAALESRYWARAHGDYDAVIAATDPQAVDGAKAWMGDKATFRARSQNEFASFKGIQILARKNLANGKVELKYQFAFQDGSTRQQTKIAEMVKINGAWRSGQTRVYDASWDDGSEPEPQA